MIEGFLDGCREEYAEGNKWALMQAIWACAQEKIPLPDWAAKAYISAYESARLGEAKSWDDLFDKPYPKGTHLNAISKERATLWLLYLYVKELKKDNPSMPIDNALFEKVGGKFNLGKTLASDYYYEAVRRDKELNEAIVGKKET